MRSAFLNTAIDAITTHTHIKVRQIISFESFPRLNIEATSLPTLRIAHTNTECSGLVQDLLSVTMFG